MKAQPVRYRSAIVGALLGLSLVDAWAAWRWVASRREASQAAGQLAACEQLAQQIELLRSAPVRVEARARTSAALAQIVESAGRQVGLAGEQITHVAPAAPRRLGDSAYLEQVTDVELRAATLQQLIELTLALPGTAPGLHVPSFVLRVPPEESEGGNKANREVWNVQMTLTSHIYAPRIATPQ